MQEGGKQRVAAKSLVEPRYGCRGARQRLCEGRVEVEGGGRRGEDLVEHHAPRRRSRQAEPRRIRSGGRTTVEFALMMHSDSCDVSTLLTVDCTRCFGWCLHSVAFRRSMSALCWWCVRPCWTAAWPARCQPRPSPKVPRSSWPATTANSPVSSGAGYSSRCALQHGVAEITEVTRQEVDWQCQVARDPAEGQFDSAMQAFDRLGVVTWAAERPGGGTGRPGQTLEGGHGGEPAGEPVRVCAHERRSGPAVRRAAPGAAGVEVPARAYRDPYAARAPG